MKINCKNGTVISLMAVLLVFFAVWALLPFTQLSSGQDQPVINATSIVNTTVNITNSAPEVRSVTLESPIDLTAYGSKTVTCNATVFDWDNDTLTVNATLYIENISNPENSNDNNTKYANSSCTNNGVQNREMNYTCTFLMMYYADNSTAWRCNVTATDTSNVSGTNISGTATVNNLVALFVPGQIDYGDIPVNNISAEQTANLTNAGNRNITIEVTGWGAVQGDNLSMNCTYGSIAINLQHYNVTSGESYTNMYSLTNASTQIPSMTVEHRFDDSQESLNYTYWKLQVPTGAGGICTGKLLFTAADAGT